MLLAGLRLVIYHVYVLISFPGALQCMCPTDGMLPGRNKTQTQNFLASPVFQRYFIPRIIALCTCRLETDFDGRVTSDPVLPLKEKKIGTSIAYSFPPCLFTYRSLNYNKTVLVFNYLGKWYPQKSFNWDFVERMQWFSIAWRAVHLIND